MKTQIWTLAVCVSIAFTSHPQTAYSQEAVALPVNPPSLNPIDPASLKDAPAFGVSGPVSKPQDAAATESPETPGTVWIPKLRVVLVTSMSEQTEVLVQTFGTNENPDLFPSDKPRPVMQKTTRTIDRPSQSSVILNCDDVNVEAVSSENDKLTYRFSCKGRALLSIDGYTVSGDSISASEGKLTVTNAVIKSKQATMSSETMILQLPILAVQVGAANARDFLKPTPDRISADRPFKTPDSDEADKPYHKGQPFPDSDLSY